VLIGGMCSAAGKAMLYASAEHLRPTSLELGGKSALLVFEDCREILPALVDWVRRHVHGP
jgi:betaine-aldehyde dehydrogenase